MPVGGLVQLLYFPSGFWVGIAALLTIFLPAPALHGPYLDAWCRCRARNGERCWSRKVDAA